MTTIPTNVWKESRPFDGGVGSVETHWWHIMYDKYAEASYDADECVRRADEEIARLRYTIPNPRERAQRIKSFIDEDQYGYNTNDRYAKLQKTADWLLSWVYDVTDGQIYIGHDHVNIIPHADNWEMKMMNNDFICGWYVREGSGVTTRIATDTVPQEHADKQHAAVEKARKAAMEYWEAEDLGEDYDQGDYCHRCDEYVGDIEEHDEYYHPREYCEHCDEYYNPNHQDHSDPFCDDCYEHVYDLDEHNKEYHFVPEPWMPKEDSTITYKGKQYEVYGLEERGMELVPLMPGGMLPQKTYQSKIFVTWDDYKQDKSEQKLGPWIETHPEQQSLENPYPGWIEPKVMQGVPTTPPSYWNTPTGSIHAANWTEPETPAIMHIVDLNDLQVFAKLSYDYMGGSDNDVDWFNFHKDQQDELDSTQDQDPDWAWDDTTKEFAPPKGDSIDQNQTLTPTDNPQYTPTDTSAQPDNAKMLDIARDWDSLEYRWSYDGKQLHMWRVYNRSAYGPSHYDMFGHDGYSNHSQGRVYVSEDNKVGMLYWQITHPECEQVCNEWCIKTFGKLPDYVYRAYGPYMGRPVSRWDFPIVEIGSLPLRQHERWWEMPGGYPGMKTQPTGYPAKKQKGNGQNLKENIQERYAPGPVDDQGSPINPSKKRRRSRKRNRKYRNRSFRR